MNADGIPVVRLRESDVLEELLGEVRQTILKHPVASQAAFSALVDEGRQYAETTEGSEVARRLARSALAHRLRLVFEVSSGWLLDEERRGVLPSSILDAIFLAANGDDLDELLGKLYQAQELLNE